MWVWVVELIEVDGVYVEVVEVFEDGVLEVVGVVVGFLVVVGVVE